MTVEHVLCSISAYCTGALIWGHYRRASLTRELTGGLITREVGHVPLPGDSGPSAVLRVHTLASASDVEPVVALVVTSKGSAKATMVPIALTEARARDLMSLLQQALTHE